MTATGLLLEDHPTQDLVFKLRKAFQGLQDTYPELLDEALYRNIVILTGAVHRHRQQVKDEQAAAALVANVSFLVREKKISQMIFVGCPLWSPGCGCSWYADIH